MHTLPSLQRGPRAQHASVSHCLESVLESVHEVDNGWLVPAVFGTWARVKKILSSLRLQFITFTSDSHQCETTRARTLSHTPGSTSPLFTRWSVLTRVHMSDPISKRVSGVSTNFRHLARQADLSKSHTRPWASALVRSRDQP